MKYHPFFPHFDEIRHIILVFKLGYIYIVIEIDLIYKFNKNLLH